MPKPTRRQIWRHNSFLGWVAMMERQLANIQSAETATDESRYLAYQLSLEVGKLKRSLQTRRDQEESK